MRCPKRSTHMETGADVASANRRYMCAQHAAEAAATETGREWILTSGDFQCDARLETSDRFDEFAERSADLKTLRAMLEQAKQHADTCQKALVQAQEDVYKARLQCRGLAYAVERLERDLKGSAP